MAHELTIRANGAAEMAYLGEVPWHGLGQAIEPEDDLDTIRRKAGMDWLIEQATVEYFAVSSDATKIGHHKFEGKKVLYRSDTCDALSVVSNKFKVVQPHEVIEFFRDLCESNHFTLTTAGTMFGGVKFWAQADIGEEATVRDDDRVKGKLLVVTACDGSLKTTCKFVNERVVCHNTLSMAMGEAGGGLVAVSHRQEFDPADVKKQLGIAVDGFHLFLAQARRMANKPVSKHVAENFLTVLLGKDGVDEKDVRETRGFKQIMNLFTNGKGNHGETAWDLLNGVTEYVDHEVRSTSVSNRLSSAWFGRGDKLKSIAFDMASALC